MTVYRDIVCGQMVPHSISIYFHLADALIQSNLQEQLGLSALLKGTSTDFSPQRFEPATFDYWPILFIVLYKCTLKGKGYHLGRMPRHRNPLRGDTRSVITHPGRLQGPRGHSGLSYRDRHSDRCALFNESQTEGGLDTDSSWNMQSSSHLLKAPGAKRFQCCR